MYFSLAFCRANAASRQENVRSLAALAQLQLRFMAKDKSDEQYQDILRRLSLRSRGLHG